MKRFVALFIGFLIIIPVFSPISQAATVIKGGTKCTKLNQKITVSKKIYQCKKSGKKLAWKYIGIAPTPKPTSTPTKSASPTPKPTPSPSKSASPSPSPTSSPSASPSVYPATGLPASRMLASSNGLLGLVDHTWDSADWAKYYGTGLRFLDGFVMQGSTFTLTWHVVDASGYPLANQDVSLAVDKGWSGSNATFISGRYIANGANDGNDGANIPGKTNARGDVSFVLTSTSSNAEPFNTKTTEKDTVANKVFGQFALFIGTATQDKTSMDIVDIHIIATPPATPTPLASSTAKTWSQEFNDSAGTMPSNKLWTALLGDGFGQLGFHNYGTGEIESNLPDAALTDGAGNLAITTKYQDGVWTSSRIWTQGKVNFQYGKIEVRMKLPAESYNWPAFWMLGSNYQPTNQLFGDTPWPNSGEIDIAEGLAGNSVVQSTLHGNYDGTTTDWNGGAGLTLYAPLSNISDGWHTWAMLWKPNMIAFTLDGVEYGRNTVVGSKIVQTVNGVDVNTFAAGGVWPFNQPFFLLIDNAIPPGTPNPANGTTSTMLIDWIHYSQYEGFGTVFQ